MITKVTDIMITFVISYFTYERAIIAVIGPGASYSFEIC